MSRPYNPFDPAFAETEFDALSELRGQGPVHEVMPGFFLVCGHNDVVSVMKNSSALGQGGFSAEGTTHIPPDERTLGQTDAPFHTEVRPNMVRAISPRALTVYEPFVRSVSEDLAGDVARLSSADLISDLAGPLVAQVTSKLAGIPAEQASEIRQYASDFMFVQSAQDGVDAQNARRRMVALEEKLLSVIVAGRAHRERVSSPVLSALLDSTDSSGRPVSDRRVLTHLTADTIVAGLETTIHLIGNMFYQILSQDGLYARLRADPLLRRATVEESLRHHSPVNFLLRTALVGVEVGGVHVPRGATLILSITSANRDESTFREPEVFRPERGEELRSHVAFGFGLHFCIGAPLARLEARCALDAVLDHISTMRLDLDEIYERVPFPIVRGPRHVRVVIGT